MTLRREPVPLDSRAAAPDRPFFRQQIEVIPMKTRALALAIVLPLAGDLRGDSVELSTGGVLRGVDLKRKAEGYLFTLESGDVVYLKAKLVGKVTKTGGREKVEFRGREITLREKIRLVRKERRVREKNAVRQIERWARGGEKAEAAREDVMALPERERERSLIRTLRDSGRAAARQLAARELSGRQSPIVLESLVEAAVRDRYRSVRDASLRSLQVLSERFAPDESEEETRRESVDVAERFTRYLRSSSRRERTHAANALAVFPSRRAMPELIRTLRMSWSGFGRAAVFQGTQRAYIGDYELVSGGTGFSIIEVADPVVRTASTGTVLDVKVVRAELIARLRAMRKISGQDFGTDVGRWQRWWNEEAPEAPAEDS